MFYIFYMFYKLALVALTILAPTPKNGQDELFECALPFCRVGA